ncbi:MAG TPA: methyltransferase domain-containing protein [Dehalococcoidia bacterium]|nr:methyltransferase domain-containing protein [Dehalococcoidia bacterium]
MLTLETLAFLRTPAGTDLLAEAADVVAATPDPLRAITRLRKRHPPELAAAALETVQLRARAAEKFPAAACMFFTAAALEQASSATVAAHIAARYAGRAAHVLDLGCGIGGNAIALARVARVTAIDRDPLRLELARANAELLGVADRVSFVQTDVRCDPLPAADAAFCDPGRRTAEGGRIFDPRRYDPPLAEVLRLAQRFPAFGIKVAPGLRDADLPHGGEVEFIQEGGTLKLAMLWLGAFAGVERRATLLPGGETLAFAPSAPLGVREPRTVLYEPQPAAIRARLIGQLGHTLDATRIDETTAFLSGDAVRATPFATAYAIDEWLPFNLKGLQRRLRALGVGRVVVKTRASPLDPQQFERMLKLDGPNGRIVVLTRVLGRHAALICRRVDTPAGDF